MTIAGLGGAIPAAVRSTDIVELATYQAVAERTIKIRADAAKKAPKK